MGSVRSLQAQALRRTVFRRMAVSLVAYTACFVLWAFAADNIISTNFGDAIADATSSWTYLSAEEYDAWRQGADSLEASGNYQALPHPDGTYAIRDLSAYYAIKSLRMPLFVGLYFAGCIVVIAVLLNSVIKQFDALACAVAGLFANKNEPITLPPSLAIARMELSEIRERALADERAGLAAEQRKNELVAYLAHDIKTPLTSVIGYVTLLAEAPDMPLEQRASYAGIALEKAEHLERLVNEFFGITRHNLQSIPIEREWIDMALLCQQVADGFAPEADRRGLSFDICTPDPLFAFVDPEKMARALSNIVRNAVAYADPATSIIVETRAEGSLLSVFVTNRGKEISEAHLRSIFDKFFREDSARSANQGGTGLGLAIAREIIAAHGGAIYATSQHGITTFTVQVPIDRRMA